LCLGGCRRGCGGQCEGGFQDVAASHRGVRTRLVLFGGWAQWRGGMGGGGAGVGWEPQAGRGPAPQRVIYNRLQ
jgi:hypothetical protein